MCTSYFGQDMTHCTISFEKRRNKIRNTNIEMSKHENFALNINKLKVTRDYINSIHSIIKGYQIMEYCNEQGRFLQIKIKYRLGCNTPCQNNIDF